MKRYPLFFLILLFLSCNSTLHLADVQPASYKVTSTSEIKEDQEILNMVEPYKKQLDSKMNQVIGESAITMRKASPQSTLGNWMADLIHKKSEDYYGKPIDFAIVNYGGIRSSELRKGPVTRGKVFELMPFENRLLVLSVKGDVAKQLFDHMANRKGWPISKQVSYKIKGNKATGITIHNKPLNLTKIYTIAMADFIANGGDNCDFLKDQKRFDLNHLFRDAIMEFVEEETAAGNVLDAEMDHRVVLVNE